MSKLKDFFKPEDFYACKGAIDPTKYAAESANKKLQELAESWPVVYGIKDSKNGWCAISDKAEDRTHKMRLAFIEELPKEPCKHEPAYYDGEMDTNQDGDYYCDKCNAIIVPTWNVKI